MNIIENLTNINNNISNIYNNITNMSNVVINLPDRPNYSGTNAEPEDVMEGKIYYGPNRS